MITPQTRNAFWDFSHSASLLGAKVNSPPLGLMTVSAMLPGNWPKKLVDLRFEELTQGHLDWADMAMISAMTVQADSARQALEKCRKAGVTTVAGGPHFFLAHDDNLRADHIFRGEAEELMPLFLADLKNGRAKEVYQSQRHPDLGLSPPPDMGLVNVSDYASFTVQWSRGCPHDCDFCSVTTFLGRRQRYKAAAQITAELDSLYATGYRGAVFVADDNLLGRRQSAGQALEAVREWQQNRRHPFIFFSQVTMEAGRDPEMLSLMNQAGFSAVFVGIESPSQQVLSDCGKTHNLGLDPVETVKTIQGQGLEVMAGLMVGFDNDPPDIIEKQEEIVNRAGIPSATISLLSALPGTRLYEQMKSQGRLLGDSPGDYGELDALNFVTKRDGEQLRRQYSGLLARLFSPEAYFNRALTFFDNSSRAPIPPGPAPRKKELLALMRIFWSLGVRGRWPGQFWKFLGKVLASHPSRLPAAFAFAYACNHFERVARRLGRPMNP